MADPDTAITLKDVFTMITKLVGQQEAIHQRNLMADQLHTDHEQRLRMLERWRYALPASVVVGLGSLGTALAAFIGHH
jgi:hypothetical protein